MGYSYSKYHDMNTRNVRSVHRAERVNMGGHLLDQALPTSGIDSIDPFLLIHHWDHPLAGGQRPQEVGVGPHPHRGFSPVTFVYKGNVEHRDSLGNHAIVEAGGTQWMHAGRGITHSERPGAELAAQGGDHEFIQFWVNTPAAHKMETPYYVPISADETPSVQYELATVRVVAGTFQGVTGPAKIYSPQTLLRVDAQQGARLALPLPTTFNTLLYILDGQIITDDQEAGAQDMIWFQNNAETIEINILNDARFIVLSGEPIGEPVASYGPFIMNNQTEIMEAIRDAQMGKMGILIEEF